MNNSNELPDDRPEPLAETLNAMKGRIERIEQRLASLEPVPPEPPPKLPSYAPPPIQFAPVTPSKPPIPPPVTPSPGQTASPDQVEDAEMRFGSVVLPRVGAGFMLLGIAYLVGLSISRGWITPWHQFWGAIALCAAAIGVGLWKRQERFDFGQVLIGMGSCGLYLACAMGHAFHNLFTGEALVMQFVAISFLNLAYGAATPSRSFVGIGILGGLVAALLPMRENHVLVSLGLNLAIAVPAAAIVGWHRWREMAVATWMATVAAAAAPVFHLSGPWMTQIAVFYGVSLAGILAYAWSHKDWEFDPQAAFLPFAAILTGFLGFARQGGTEALVHELALGAALAGAAFGFKSTPVRTGLLLGGLLTAFLFAPFGLEGTHPAWAYLSLGLASALLSWRILPKAALAFAGLGLGLGLATYVPLVLDGRSIPVGEEIGLLTLAMAGLATAAWSAGRHFANAETATFLGMVAAAPLAARFATVLLSQPAFELSPSLASTIALLPLAGAGAILAMRKSWVLMTLFAWSAFFAAGVLYISHVQMHAIGLGFELGLLGSLLLVACLSGSATVKTGSNESGAGFAGFIGWGIFSRMVFLVATQPSIGMSYSASLTLGWTLYALILITIGFLADRRALRLTSLGVFGATVGKVLMVDLAALDPAIRVVLLLLLGSGMIAGGYAYIRRSKTLGGPPAGAAV